jgi:hypothetical protein
MSIGDPSSKTRGGPEDEAQTRQDADRGRQGLYSRLTCNANQIRFKADYEEALRESALQGQIDDEWLLRPRDGREAEHPRDEPQLDHAGEKGFRMVTPVFEGDSIFAEVIFLSRRHSTSDREMGIVELRGGSTRKGSKSPRWNR